MTFGGCLDITPQFGTAAEGQTPRGRPAAFGILEDAGKLALVRITPSDGGSHWLDLPGGALDPGETAKQALVREFGEETGLIVEARDAYADAAQYFKLRDGEAVNNLCSFHTVTRNEGVAKKIEDDHELVWVEVRDAITQLRHDAHAWGVSAWLRSSLAKT